MRDPLDAHDVFQNEHGQPENPTLADIQDQLNDLSVEMHERFAEIEHAPSFWDAAFSIWGLLIIMAIGSTLVAIFGQ